MTHHHPHAPDAHGHDHPHDHEHAGPTGPELDAHVADQELDPGQFARRSFLRGAGLLAATGAVGASSLAGAGAAAAAYPPPARGARQASAYRWSGGDHHIHTQYSGGSDAPYTIPQQALQANRFGLGWIVITDHGGPLHQKFGVDRTFADIELARRQNGDLLIFQGLEWNPPAGDHSTVFVPPGDNALAVMKEFEALFDASITTTFRASSATNEAKAREAVRWLADQVRSRRVGGALQILNHPSRSGAYAPSEMRGLRDAAPGVAIGMEGAPGHQAAGIPTSERGAGEGRGFYDSTAAGANAYSGYPFPESYRTYGGFDWLTAKLGGVWDSMLAEGRPYFISATSDSHQVYRDTYRYGGAPTPEGQYFDPVFTREEIAGRGDFWPGQYSQTVVGLEDFSYGSVVNALRSGRSYAVHGHLVDGVQLDVTAAGQQGIGTFGDTVRRGRNRRVDVKVRVQLRTLPNFNGDVPELARLDLISGPITGPVTDPNSQTSSGTRVVQSWEISRVQQQAGVAEFTYRFDRNDGPFYLRLRGTDGNRADGGPTGLEPLVDVIGDADPWKDLWFYSNPVFIVD